MTTAPADTGRSDQLRLSSGIERLDEVLCGGFIRGGTYALLGPSGSGKTIMANQICSAHIARDAGRCVYVSLLVESHARLIAHLENMQFFRREFIPDKLFYINGYQSLRTDGLPGLLRLLRSSVQERNATVLVVDGLESVRTAASSEREFGEFIHQLQAFTGVADCTMFLASLARATMDETERVLADGVIELDVRLVGPRAVREIHVSKFRGSSHLPGKHEMTISDAGMRVHPRTELLYGGLPEKVADDRKRMAFGVAGLDAMMGGGPRAGSLCVLLGAPGVGKSSLGLSFLAEGARQGQRAIYLGCHEAPAWLIEKGDALGLNMGRLVGDERVRILWQPPIAVPLDEVAEMLLAEVERERPSDTRLFIDGLDAMHVAAAYPGRMASFLPILFNRLRALGVTAVVADHLSALAGEPVPATPEIVHAADGIVRLRNVELRTRRHRLISILKMRDSDYDTSIRELTIRRGGIDVTDMSDDADEVAASALQRKGQGAGDTGSKRRRQ